MSVKLIERTETMRGMDIVGNFGSLTLEQKKKWLYEKIYYLEKEVEQEEEIYESSIYIMFIKKNGEHREMSIELTEESDYYYDNTDYVRLLDLDTDTIKNININTVYGLEFFTKRDLFNDFDIYENINDDLFRFEEDTKVYNLK